MKILIRCDASNEIGSGHLRRQLTLIEELIAAGVTRDDIYLVITKDPYAEEIAAGTACRITWLPPGDPVGAMSNALRTVQPNLVVFDQKFDYPTSAVSEWRRSSKLAVIDYIGAMTSHVDITIMPTGHFIHNGEPNVVHGMEYVILNKRLRGRFQQPRRAERHVAVATGGTDPARVMFKLYDMLKDHGEEYRFLAGDGFAHKKELEEVMQKSNSRIKLEDFSFETIVSARAVICAQGVSAYECLYLRVPTLLVTHSRENDAAARTLSERYPHIGYLGYVEELTADKVKADVSAFVKRSAGVVQPELINDQGARNVAKKLLQLGKKK